MKYEKIELIVQSSETGTIYDISNICKTINTSKAIDSTAGKCEFSIDTNIHKISFPMGSSIKFKVDGHGKFFGYIFSMKPSKNELKFTAYDQLRYLRNNESYVLTNYTATSLIQRICDSFNLRAGTLENTNYKLPERIEDNKALGDIIQTALAFTLIGTGKRYIIRDEFGYLCCREVSNLVKKIIIGEKSVLKDYEYDENIDTETYNQIKLYKDNKDTGKRDIYLVKDSNNQRRWGILQLYESIDENMNFSQASEKAHNLLKKHNRVMQKLSLKCDGILDLEVGDGIRLLLTDIPNKTLNENVLITKIEDTFKNGLHTMTLEVEI